ncbi:MAG: hypothetical protein QNJ90_02915 [Planctomycetota bacterium]|nr:hypothetical protein [Planctomycetota bacterium]
MRIIGLLLLAGVFAGCCCNEPETGPRTLARATAPYERQFVVLRATPLDGEAEGKRQILVESSVVSVRRRGPIEALERAEPLGTLRARAWLAGTQVPDATFGADATVLAKPSVISASTETAAIELHEETGDGAPRTGTSVQVTPELDASGALSIVLSFRRHVDGRIVREIPAVALEGPAGRVFIVEAMRP